MLWFHPVFQALTTLLAMYVAFLGVERFMAQHLRIKRLFRWKRHVQLGKIVILFWFAGLVGGLAIARITWSVNFVTGIHYKVALAMLPLMIFGYVSGSIMDTKKRPRNVLPLLHGINNAILLLLAIFQIRTGWGVLQDFVF